MKKTILVLLVGLIAGGCTSNNNTSPVTTPTGPTVSVTSETFTGSVDVAGRDIHSFAVALTGSQLSVNLTSAGPPSTIFMGLGVGTFSDPTCTLFSNASVVTQAATSAQLSGTVNAGTYCVMVYDAGNQTVPVSYSVTVNHF